MDVIPSVAAAPMIRRHSGRDSSNTFWPISKVLVDNCKSFLEGVEGVEFVGGSEDDL